MRYRLPLTIAATLLAALGAQAGDIYRWKDAKGSWHYADQPVPGAERISSATRTAPTADAAATPPATRSSTAGATSPTAQIAQKVKQDVAVTRAEHCKQAQAAYEQAISARRLFRPGANGEPEYLDETQIEAHRVAARSEMETLCGP